MSNRPQQPWRDLAAPLAVLALIAAVTSATARAQCISDETHLVFTEDTEAGVGDDLYVTPSFHSLGLVWIDFNNDLWPDLYAVNGFGGAHHLFLNDGGTFTPRDDLLPAISDDIEMAGAVFGDYDNDGDSDIFVYNQHETLDGNCNCNPQDGHLDMLFKNLWMENGEQLVPGQTLFVDVAAAAGVTGEVATPFGEDYAGRRTLSAAFFDYNRDGCLDLYTVHWAIRHLGEASNQNVLYRNNCDGTFTDVTEQAGLPTAGLADPDDLRPTLALLAAHLDDDLWPDLYAVNVSERADPLPESGDTCVPECPERWYDQIYRNNGDGTFTEMTQDSPGVGDDTAAGMGIDVSDLDLDGDWDIYISDLYNTSHDHLPRGNPLYKGNGDGTWADNSAVEDCVDGRPSWPVSFFDADHDGYEELFVGAGAQDLLFHNRQDGTFVDVADAAGLDLLGQARGSATADYDRDGDVDFVVLEMNGNLRLYRNDTAAQDQGNWLELKLVGVYDPEAATSSNRDAIGTVVHVQAAGLGPMMRQIEGGSSAHSQDDLVLHFGLADATVAEVRVLWPSGREEIYFNLPANSLHTLVEGQTLIFADGFESGDLDSWSIAP